jgi:hypothetical protein
MQWPIAAAAVFVDAIAAAAAATTMAADCRDRTAGWLRLWCETKFDTINSYVTLE